MFCPLCKSEFREGFTQCSDCHVPLAATYDEAARTPVDCLWNGDDRRRCHHILDSLIAADIPYHSKESLKKKPWPWISMLLWRFMKPRPTFEFQIWVLDRDRSRAEAAVPEEPKDDWEGEEDDENERPALT
jgi:hypothetical protein